MIEHVSPPRTPRVTVIVGGHAGGGLLPLEGLRLEILHQEADQPAPYLLLHPPERQDGPPLLPRSPQVKNTTIPPTIKVLAVG